MKINKIIRAKINEFGLQKHENSIRYFFNFFKSIGHGGNLTKIAIINKTDKYGTHFYTPHYQEHFKKFKFKKIKLLEIGVGGYDNPNQGGASLRMWKRYFPYGRIFSIDIYDKSPLQENRIKIFQGSQVDSSFLSNVIKETGPLDLIIDDGSHECSHVIETFKILFPYLKSGGIYAIEDTQTSYWPASGGNSLDLEDPKTSMNYFKKLTDCLNHKEFMLPNYDPSYYDLNIVSIHFYHNLIFIYKGDNTEESNKFSN